MKINVFATTQVCSNSGRWYDHHIRFSLDLESGKISEVEERGCLGVRPYMLVALVAQVIARTPLAKGDWPKVRFAKNPCRQPGRTHPALEVEGKRYRLTHNVSAGWLKNPHAVAMAAYVLTLEEDSIVFDFVPGLGEPMWNIWYQEI